MLTSRDLHTEIDMLEKIDPSNQTEALKAIIKGLVLVMRLEHNNRTNLTLIMDKLQVEKVKPQVGINGDGTRTTGRS